jgi:hypothetical protein
MKPLAEKIVEIYPELVGKNFMQVGICVVNDNNGTPEYIAIWEHPTLPRPTQEQLDGVQ